MKKKLIILTIILTPLFTLGQKSSYKVVLNRELSSNAFDFAPRLIGNSQMIFSSDRKTKNNKGRNGEPVRENIFYSQIGNNVWSNPIPLIDDANSFNFGVVTFDTIRRVMFYTACPMIKGIVNKPCAIYYSFLKGTLIGEPLPLNLSNNVDNSTAPITLGHPYFSNTLDILFFVSDMPGGYGKMDIWFSVYDRSTDTWGKPQNAGPEVNTDKNEFYPFVTNDGTLYFTSEGHNGFGGWDIYCAILKNKFSWSNVLNLGKPINSAADDFGIIFNGTDKGYFSSNRKGGFGDDDIYEFSAVTSKIIPIATNDSNNKETIHALTTVFNKEACILKKELPKVSKTKLFPNPNNGTFTFEFDCSCSTNFNIRIFTNLGQLISIESIAVNDGHFTKVFNLSGVSNGIYYVQVLYDCEILQSEKVIVNK